jgi:hypothetical protein
MEFFPPNNEFSSGNNGITMETADRPDVVANRDIGQVGAAPTPRSVDEAIAHR